MYNIFCLHLYKQNAMKKIITLLLIILSYSSKSQFYNQYFDGGVLFPPYSSITIHIDNSSENSWQIGRPSKTLFNSSNTSPKAIVTDTLNYYPINDTSTFSFAIPLTNFPWAPIALQWTQKINFDMNLDGGIVEFSNDSVTWENAGWSPYSYQFYGYNPINLDGFGSVNYGFTGTDNTWRDIWLCIDPNYGHQNDTLFFRFTSISDNINTNKEGWMIDNFQARTTVIHPVKETSQIDDIVVYPNISTGMVNIEMKKTKATDKIENIEMIDETGKVVEVFGKTFTKVVLDIKKHKPGLYYFRVTTNNKPKLFKVIYEKN